MEKKFRAISITHELAGVSIREKFSLSAIEVEGLYIKLSEVLSINESMILVTCNRAEIYYFHENDLNEALIKLWASFKALSAKDFRSSFYTYYDRDAIEHLYRVSIGLKSQILGDIQIFGQVKQAYQSSLDAGMAATLLNRLMHKVFFCHKAVNQETAFKSGAASVSYNAVNVLEKDDLAPLDAKILVVGAGQMGSDICRHLHKKGYSNIFITNRTMSKAEKLAEECDMSVIPFDMHRSMIDEFDVVYSTVTCESPVYYPSHFEDTAVKAVIDVSSPRSVDPKVEQLEIALYNVDKLGKLIDHVMRRREEEIPKVEELIRESISEYMTWTEDLIFSDSVKRFKTTLEELRTQTMASMLKKMNEEEKGLVEEVTKRMLQKIVDLPVMSMKTACLRDQEPSELSETLNELFNIEYKKQVKS
ncbi:glutamyl-tRNA reductase [Reichenbachiella versicolor]|uniref:glutamyl-tRNA reductase n=1 Tax=Reichenbachiella versicolor TaxID=1821036 RepID=UPI000D6E1332|nr:glutamyl-tRNA reductase [Reichenbachiella versicolor]